MPSLLEATRGSVTTGQATPRRARPWLGTGLTLLGSFAWFFILAPSDHGWLRCTALAVLVVAGPTADALPRRVVYNLTLGMVLFVAASWLPFRELQVPALIAACTALTTVTAVRRGPRSLVPSCSRVEVGAGLAAMAFAGWAGSGPATGRSATTLVELMRGWDHASHFDMYLAHRTGSALGAGSTGEWYFAHYPQFFHAFISQLAAAVWGGPGSTLTELERYAGLQAVVFVLTVVLAVAVVLAATEQTRSGARVAALLLVATLMFVYPGASLVLAGHLNFLLSAVAGAAAITLSNRGEDEPSALHVVVMAGLVVVVASWPLLLPGVAAPAIKLLVRGLRSRCARWWTAAAAVGSAVASAGLVLTSIGGDPVGHLVATGGLVHTNAASTACILAAVLAVSWYRRSRGLGSDLLVATATSSLLLAVIAAIQLSTAGELGYYFWKASIGVELMLLISASPGVPAVWHVLVGRLSARTSHLVAVSAVGSVGALAALLLVHTLPIGALALYSVRTDSPTAAARTAEQVLGAAEDRSLYPATTTVVSSGADFSPALVDQWYHSLTRTRTVDAGQFDADLDRPWTDSTSTVPQVARSIAGAGTRTVVVIDPSLFELITQSGDGGGMSLRR